MDVGAGDVAEILEFLATFAGSQTGVPAVCGASLAAELTRAAVDAGDGAAAAPRTAASAVAAVHIALLDAVRRDWGIPGSVSDGWTDVMRQYLAADTAAAAAAVDTAEAAAATAAAAASRARAPPHRRSSLAGQRAAAAAARDADADAAAADAAGDAAAAAAAAAGAAAARDAVAAAAATAEDAPPYPSGGYWGLPPGVRVRMLRALVHDALDTAALRAAVESGLETDVAADRARRDALAAARKDARDAWAKQRDAAVGAMLASAGAACMTAEDQRALVAASRARASKQRPKAVPPPDWPPWPPRRQARLPGVRLWAPTAMVGATGR